MEATIYRLMSLAALTFCLTTILVPAQLFARDDGRFANSEPNRFGPAVVWPYNDRYGNTQIRCFMPGAGT